MSIFLQRDCRKGLPGGRNSRCKGTEVWNGICLLQEEIHRLVCLGRKMLEAVAKVETGRHLERASHSPPQNMGFVPEAGGNCGGVCVPHFLASC